MKTGIELVSDERQRQLNAEQYDAAHDDLHVTGELQLAALCYKCNSSAGWPWGLRYWKPTTELRNLIKAGALYLAEADRYRRSSNPGCAEMMHLEVNDCVRRIDKIIASTCKWRVHIIGPDDLVLQPDETTALREANRLNIFISQERLKHANDPLYPWSMAVVEKDGVEYHGGAIAKSDSDSISSKQ